MLTDDQFDRIADIILEANPRALGRLDKLRRRVSQLLIAVGVTDDGTESSAAFRKMADPIDHAAMAELFRAIAASDDPLAFAVLSDRLHSREPSRLVRAELSAAAHSKWSGRTRKDQVRRPKSLRRISSSMLTEIELEEVRVMATELAHYHQSQVRRKRPNKNALDTILEELGDLYAELTKFSRHRHELPYSANSHFISFCRLVLQPFFDPSEVTPKAISHRWRRLRDR
jgi:hypothetical protein